MEEWMFWVIFIGGVIVIFTIILCCICSWCESEDSGELENFQIRNINIKDQRVQLKEYYKDLEYRFYYRLSKFDRSRSVQWNLDLRKKERISI